MFFNMGAFKRKDNNIGSGKREKVNFTKNTIEPVFLKIYYFHIFVKHVQNCEFIFCVRNKLEKI